ncbi:CPBP family intramembrane glutamic endopeptidase [Rhodopirellula sp. P2]|uniref:CPBP family intramembrane glutamic endopeptidase n=1 Tax=Rhodopirellula sp. P2 TaxID=2127060 RepID=UPI002368C8D3|nr:CPBP family intramembrane glutamic endopeptidase [Rhodopirellula sp. P2]WDQ17304.1 CPBP family intramembrane metalloprotease [Rhodopirellula sp. P2]
MSFGLAPASWWARSFLAQGEVALPTDSAESPALGEIAADTAEVVELGPTEIALSILSILILLAFATSLSRWIRMLYRGHRPFGEKAFVPVRARHLPFWSVIYFVVFIGALIFSTSLLQGAFQFAGWIERPAVTDTAVLLDSSSEPLVATDPSEPTTDQVNEVAATESDPVEETEAATTPGLSVPQLTLSSLGMLSATLITLAMLCLNHREAISRIGLIPQRGDISLGFRSALMILPPTMLIMTLVSIMQDYSHPVLDALQPDEADAGPNYGVFALLFITTALVTPVVEEFWIRGLLQGGLQRLADWRLAIVRKSLDPAVASIETPGNEFAYGVADTEESTDETASLAATAVSLKVDSNDWTPTAIWPVFAASLVFALLHWGQGLAPIPLFFLSLGLGYLYRQTGSLIPPIIVHFVLNGLTMVMTLIEMSRA